MTDLVDRQNTLRLDSFDETIGKTRVQIAILVVHPGHDCIRGVHHHTDCNTTACTSCNVLDGPFTQQVILFDLPLCDEVSWELDTASSTCPDYRTRDTAVQSPNALRSVNRPRCFNEIFIRMLCANGESWRVRLQSSFEEKERRPSNPANNAGQGPREYIDIEKLFSLISRYKRGGCGSNGLVKSQTTSWRSKWLKLVNVSCITTSSYRSTEPGTVGVQDVECTIE